MSYAEAEAQLLTVEGVEHSTLMKTPCLRYKGEFIGMMFDKAEALIIKVPPQRVQQLIAAGLGTEFNFTKKPFKEWVLIPLEFEEDYLSYLNEALSYAQLKFR